ncbi:hypothetical protein NDA01_29860 [Trichocoleus desertorum AS-A10]|uniref:hypothetical protein n=1 Tax=Trichocoleus desertorum TaxID=1481672 RepID=UPI0032980D02
MTRTRCMNRDRSQPPILLKQRGLQPQPLKFLLPLSLPQAPLPNASPQINQPLVLPLEAAIAPPKRAYEPIPC